MKIKETAIMLTGFQNDFCSKERLLYEPVKEVEKAVLLTTAVESLPIGITISDAERKIVYTNTAEAVIHGYMVEELIGMNARIFAPLELWKPIDFEQLYEMRIWKRDSINIRKNGEVFPVQLTSIAVKGANGMPIGIITACEDITERKETEKKLIDYQKQLQSLASQLSLIEERERRRIAIDLHDHIGQNLALCKIKLGALRESTSPNLAISIDEIHGFLEQTIQYTRSLTFELSTPILYELGFEAALEWLGEQILNKHGILFHFEDDRKPKPMEDETRIILFQAVRELLVNVVKHAEARNASVFISREGDCIRINLEDDGVGFNVSKVNSYHRRNGEFGLFSIRERLNYIGCYISIEFIPGSGTRVTIIAPLKINVETETGEVK